MTDPRLPAGHQPYDSANALRVGGISGALVGGGLFAFSGWPPFVILGAAGGAVGAYLWQRRQQRRRITK